MRELREICGRLAAMTSGEAAVLATVVDLKGSSYRLPGAKMLISRDGQTLGTVSGGCLEADLLERATRVFETGIAEVFLYDTTGDEESVFSLNMGCRGVIRILLERVSKESEYGNFLRRCLEGPAGGIAVTCIASEDRGDDLVGRRAFFEPDGSSIPGSDSEWMLETLRESKVQLFPDGTRATNVLSLKDGVELFVEIVSPPPLLQILGAGADAVPLARLAYEVGWRVTVIDHRSAFANPERFPFAERIVVSPPTDAGELLRENAGHAAVLMTHNFAHDKEYLKHLFASDPAYIGILGPKVRTDSLLKDLSEEGHLPRTEQLKKLFAPVGLDIGGSDPETIAVSILAEIQTVFSGREAGFLRDREAPIYDR